MSFSRHAKAVTPYPYIINRNKLPNWNEAKANLESGATQKYNVCSVGDSVDEGLLATDILNGSFLGLFRTNCASKYGDRGKGFLPSYYSETYPTSYWNYTGSWTLQNGAGVCGCYMETSTQNDSTTITVLNGTDLHVFVRTGTGYGTFDVTVDGTTTHLDAGIATDLFHEFTVTGLTDTTHTIVIKNTSSSKLGLIGAYCDRGNKGFNVHMMGKGGAGAGGFTSSYSLNATISHWQPVLTIISLIANDFNVQTSLATYKNNIQILIDEAKKYGDVLLTSIGLRKHSYPIKQEEYVNVLYDLADENDIAFLNYFGIMNAGLLGANMDFIKDEVHLSDSGHHNAFSYLEKTLFY